MSTPFVLRGQQLIEQIQRAENEAARKVLIAELHAHLSGGAKPMPADFKVAQSGERE
jgi:hypothetical protein